MFVVEHACYTRLFWGGGGGGGGGVWESCVRRFLEWAKSQSLASKCLSNRLMSYVCLQLVVSTWSMRANALARVLGSDTWYALWLWYAMHLPLLVLRGLRPMTLSISLSCLILVGAWRAFGFGANHDAAIMHAICEVSGGTFSFIQAKERVQDAFAQCIGGLLSVVAQDVELNVSSWQLSQLCCTRGQHGQLNYHGSQSLGDQPIEEARRTKCRGC
ncbi:hypothetical protein GOP47_0015152 [Adiantum capillus-veneris]|uniref:Uncharacterized protein n=1 Tax=Adiantum capillus-veneris TaxID=13818 RepID=A0A9D4ZD34_ADICA|nr:hypothetical protein GOP47_0015152 [Adiantum capillus-veneris]